MLHGLPINSQHEYTGGFWNLFTPFGLWMGLTMVVLSLLMGATYLTLKTTGELHARAQRAATGIGAVAVVVSFGFFTWVHVGLSTGFVPEPLEALALMAVIAAAWLTSSKADGWAFVAAAVGIGGTVGSIFTELFPRVMISTTNTAYNLTVGQHGQPALHPQGDDGGRGRHGAGCRRLPGLGVPHLPGTADGPQGGYGRWRRGGGRDHLTGRRRSDQSPGLLCMMPPSAKIVVAVM